MAVVLTGKDQMFGVWAARLIPAIGKVENFGKFRAVGVATGSTPDDKLMAAFIFHDWHEDYKTCQISAASVDPRWVSRAICRAVLSIPFLQYHANKCWVAIPHTSERTVRLVKALGFTQEAVLKSHFGRGTHAVICRMEEHEYTRRYFDEEKKAA